MSDPPPTAAEPPLLSYSDQPLAGRVLVRQEPDRVTIELPPRGLLQEIKPIAAVFGAMALVLPLGIGALAAALRLSPGQLPWRRLLEMMGWLPFVLPLAICLAVAAFVAKARTIFQLSPEELEVEQSIFGLRRRSRWPRSAIVGVGYRFGRLHIRTVRGQRDGWVIRSDKPALRWTAEFLQRQLSGA